MRSRSNGLGAPDLGGARKKHSSDPASARTRAPGLRNLSLDGNARIAVRDAG